jgi:hypothetical protein
MGELMEDFTHPDQSAVNVKTYSYDSQLLVGIMAIANQTEAELWLSLASEAIVPCILDSCISHARAKLEAAH